MRRCYDASKPSKSPPPWWICGFYPLGMTPHTWADSEIRADPARFGLPIIPWVGADLASMGHDMGGGVVSWLEARGIPRGITVAVDTETFIFPQFLPAMDAVVKGAGYLLMNYGSLRYVVRNPLLSGGRWTATWTDTIHLDNVPGERGTQYASATQLKTDYDASVFEDSVPLWEKRTPTPPPIVSWEDVVLRKVDSALANLDTARRIITTHMPK